VPRSVSRISAPHIGHARGAGDVDGVSSARTIDGGGSLTWPYVMPSRFGTKLDR